LDHKVTNVAWSQFNGNANGWRFTEGKLDTVGNPQYPKQIMPSDLVYCYPNPVSFGELANLRFTLLSSAEIEVSVFNALGSSVESFSERLLSGENEITWDVRSYASGLYFCRIVATTDQSTETQIVKMAIKR